MRNVIFHSSLIFIHFIRIRLADLAIPLGEVCRCCVLSHGVEGGGGRFASDESTMAQTSKQCNPRYRKT